MGRKFKKNATFNDPISTAREKQQERKEKEREIAKKFAEDQAMESALILKNHNESAQSQQDGVAGNKKQRQRKSQNDGTEAIHKSVDELIRAQMEKDKQESGKKFQQKKGKAKASASSEEQSSPANMTADVAPDEVSFFSTGTPKNRNSGPNIFEDILSGDASAEAIHNGTNGITSAQKPSSKRKRIASSSSSSDGSSDSSALSLTDIGTAAKKAPKPATGKKMKLSGGETKVIKTPLEKIKSIVDYPDTDTGSSKKGTATKKIPLQDSSDDGSSSDGDGVITFDNTGDTGTDDEEFSDEEQGDDLEDEELIDHDAAEMDLEDEEDETLGGFIAEDVEEESMDDEEDDVFSDDSEYSDTVSVSSDFQLDILGYTVSSETPLCVVLKAQEGYTTASHRFALHQFSEGSPSEHSVNVGLKALHWILKPLETQTFFSEVFQNRALVINRATSNYYEGFFGTDDFVKALQDNIVLYDTNINIASYVNGVRHTHNHPLSVTTQSATSAGERFNAYQMKEHLALKRSVQCINPQAFNDNIWYLCEVLQEVFCSFVGANNYLTPANSAGFAPHWDDVDTFILQTEGRKHWKVYAPESKENSHPLNSSGNFTDEDFNGRIPVFDGWLERGDLMYLPRGFIHQAHTDSKVHSHHVTISVCRKFSYADFFEKVVPEYIKNISTFSTKMRLSLPPLLLDMAGVASIEYSNTESMDLNLLPTAGRFLSMLNNKFHQFLPSFVDLMAKEFMRTTLPPLLTPFEREHSCLAEKDVLAKPKKFTANTEVRLIRKHAQRLVYETEEKPFIVHRMANSREKENASESQFDLPIHLEACFIKLMDAYPNWTSISDLGPRTVSELGLGLGIELAELLYARCLLLKREAGGDTAEKESGVTKQKSAKKQGTEKKQQMAKNPTADSAENVAAEETEGKPKKKKKRNKKKGKAGKKQH